MFFERFLHTDPSKTALKYQGREISYGDLYQQIRSRAAWLRRHPADYLLCHSSEAENLISFLALMYTGRKGVFCGKNVSPELKLAYAEKYNLGLLDFLPEVSRAVNAPYLPAKKQTISPVDSITDAFGEVNAPYVPEEKYIPGADDPIAEPPGALHGPYRPSGSDYFLGVLSSGTGGNPKIIWKDYRSWFNAFPAQSEVFGMQAEDRVMVVDALGYSANLNTVIHTLWLGATVVLTPLREAKNWENLIRSEAISSLFLVPSHYRLLPENTTFPGLTSAVSAGEKLDPLLAEKLLRIFPEACLTEYYGAAELGHISYIQNREIVEKPGSVGRPFPGVSIRIREEKIWVESPYISPEYRHAPTVSDMGFIDTEGYLCLLGREGRMFNRRGLNIFAEEIENAARLHPAIAEAVLLPDTRNPEHLTLLLVRTKPVSQDELRDFLLKSVANDKLPNSILFTEDIPRNSSGKVDFKVLSKKPVDEDSFC